MKSVLFFNLVDEPNLDRWQSGLMRADWTRRPSYAIVKGSILAGQTRCNGRRVRWRHAIKPVGVNMGFLGGSRARSDRNRRWSFVAGSEEGTLYTAGALPRARVQGRSRRRCGLASRELCAPSRAPGAALKASGKLVGGWDKVITFRLEAPQARVLRLRGPDRRGDESRARGDVRRPGVRRPQALALDTNTCSY